MNRKVATLIRVTTSLLALVILPVGLTLVPAAYATPSISEPSIEFDNKSGVGSGAESVNAVVAADLDTDGKIDLVTATNSGTNEIRARRNDGAPFASNWDSRTQTVTNTNTAVNNLAAGDLNHDGEIDLVSGDSNDLVYIWKNEGDPFGSAWNTSKNVGSGVGNVEAIALADFDNDGNLDILSGSGSDAGAGYELIVWQNPYTTVFTDVFSATAVWTQTNIANTVSVYAVTVADLDNDGLVDIVTGDVNNQVRLYENAGAWTFTLRTTLTADGNVSALALADFNRDGYIDIASGGPVEGGGTYEVIVWENDADAVFDWSYTRHDMANTDIVMDLVAADFNNDGYFDIGVVSDAGGSGDGGVYALENDADAPFDWSFIQVGIGTETGLGLRAVTAVDLDSDGDADLVTGREGGSGDEVAAWENDLPHRNAPFADSGQSLGTDRYYDVSLRDLDGDGDLDAFIASDGNRVYTNDGNGVFTDSGQTLGSDRYYDVAVGDLDGDGDLDAVTSAGIQPQSRVWINQGGAQSGTPGVFVGTAQLLGYDAEQDVALGDLDGDGDLDAFFVARMFWHYGENTVWLNNGSGTFSDSGQRLGTAYSWAVTLGDLDGDGDLDAFVANISEGNRVWLNNGSGTFSDSGQRLGAAISYDAALGDVDGDGDLDAFVANYDQANTVWLNNGSGTFTDSGQTLGSSNSYHLALGDADGDGDLDAFVANRFQPNKVWANNGSGIFTDSGQAMGSSESLGVSLGDVDRDGDLDAFVVNYSGSPSTGELWRNAGGSAGLDVTDTAPMGITDGEEDDVLRVVFAHNGIANDHVLELSYWNVNLLQDDCATPLTSAEANAIIDALHVRLDDGDGLFEANGDDVAVAAVTDMTNGVQQLSFIDGEANVQVAGTNSKTYWISALTTSDASSQDPHGFCVSFDPDVDALVEGKTPDFGVSLQDTEPTNTGGISNDAPTAVTLARFEAASQADAVLVEWETAIEIDNVGFNLYRSMSPGGPYVKLNEALIPSQSPGSVWGAVYTWLDEDVESGVTYYYKLEDIEVGGARTFHGPVNASVQDPTALSLTSFAAQGEGGLVVLLAAALGAGSALVLRRRRK